MVEEISVTLIIRTYKKPKFKKRKLDKERDVKDYSKVSWKQASDMLNTFIKFAEFNKSYNSAEHANLCIIRNDFFQRYFLKKSESWINLISETF